MTRNCQLHSNSTTSSPLWNGRNGLFASFKMQSEEKVNGISKHVKDSFGFNENEVSPSIFNDSSVLNETSAPIEFRPDKPYRLALYVRPNEQRRIQRANASFLIKSIMEKQREVKKRLNSTNSSPGGKIENGKGKRRERKLNSVSLFDDKLKPETKPKSKIKSGDNPKSKKNVTTSEKTPTRRNILTQSNTISFPSLRQTTIKRLYERKVREKETENMPDEPSSDQIMKDLQEKKSSKAKVRKGNRDEDKDEDFENWASNVNSDFNDVDQFELSVSYD